MSARLGRDDLPAQPEWPRGLTRHEASRLCRHLTWRAKLLVDRLESQGLATPAEDEELATLLTGLDRLNLALTRGDIR